MELLGEALELFALLGGHGVEGALGLLAEGAGLLAIGGGVFVGVAGALEGLFELFEVGGGAVGAGGVGRLPLAAGVGLGFWRGVGLDVGLGGGRRALGTRAGRGRGGVGLVLV